ncbi:MAG: siderophore-interacting protein [Actinophytocola sp.]|uniref:siderophore-interacting protein n=1 Tax=Actinophytocola sp. TaxID=1872138 RepID=UPI001322866E|nr:siderophore-interacting protein [Actinophytocola sp.]MPZ81562.1 siderophore-interacting protein [Actinophytocola sp.]
MDLVGLLEVTRVRSLTPRMRRVSFRAPDGFEPWPDQQLKLCFPREGQAMPQLPESSGDDMRWYQQFLAIPEDERPWMRSFTVRALVESRGEIDIDFVLHGDTGPATRWALTAAPGQVLGRYGPSAVYRRPLGSGDWSLFAGDETALPAIGTLLESLPPSARAVVYVEVADPAEEQPLPHADVRWLHRSGGASLLPAVRAAVFPSGTPFAWLAGEAGAVRALRRHLVTDRGIDKRRIDFAGYWRARLTQDDDPTAEDLAEARERLAAG